MVLDAAQTADEQKEEAVDEFLSRQVGKIERGRDDRYCKHNARSKCPHCLPLDPYDANYLKQKDIKHLSFHAHVRQLTEGHGKGTQLKKPLENVICKVRANCPGHAPYPRGICTKCRPPTLTLNRQKYRHVDNIFIENEEVVNRFLNYWRQTGQQRLGFLIGRYEPFPEVPLGIKAVVAAIYEPPQSSTTESVHLESDGNEELVDLLCQYLDLKRVGWIFTDLWSADTTKGTVHCTRHPESFLLSAEECITAGWLQAKYRNYTRYCTDGYFGSKFVTVVATGDQSEHITFSGYQVSNQCAAMVDADLLCPTNFPELAYFRKEPLQDAQYIPDLQYAEKNEYGAEVMRDGRPMPVEYLLVDVPAGMPKEPQASFYNPRAGGFRFPTENRVLLSEIQDSHALSSYINQFTPNQFLELATNFHFLLFLLSNVHVKFTKEEVRQLCDAVKQQDRTRAMDWASDTSNWATLRALCDAHQDGAVPTERWFCSHCTFENSDDRADCAMCGLPKV